MKKKILYFITKSNWGGAQRYVFDLTNSLKDDYEIVVASGGNGILFEKLNHIGIKTISIPFLERDIKIWNESKVINEIYKIIKSEKPNIIHLNSPKIGLLAGVSGRFYNLFNKEKVKIIQTIHGFPFYEPRSIIWKSVMYFSSYWSLVFANYNIFVSQRDLQATHRMIVSDKKLKYIPNGIPEIDFLERSVARQKLIGENNEKLLIGTIAELNHNKGLNYLIESLNILKHKNIKCVIVGDGEKRNELEDLKSELNVDVTFVGHLNEANKYLKAFDIFILPSLKEGLPYVLLEAGIARLPVISTNVGGIPFLIESGKNGTLVNSKNSKDLSIAISNYIENEELIKNHVNELKKLVQEEYNLKQMIEKTVRLYN